MNGVRREGERFDVISGLLGGWLIIVVVFIIPNCCCFAFLSGGRVWRNNIVRVPKIQELANSTVTIVVLRDLAKNIALCDSKGQTIQSFEYLECNLNRLQSGENSI